MRYAGLTLCLLASSLSARAESVEDRVAALEARVKALETALNLQTGRPATVVVDGTYAATLPNGEAVTLELRDGRATAITSKESKTGTFEVVADRVVLSAEGKTETLRIENGKLKADKIEFTKTK